MGSHHRITDFGEMRSQWAACDALIEQ